MHIALIDDESLFRMAIRSVLSSLDHQVVIDEHAQVPSADSMSLPPDSIDLVLLDYHIPGSEFLANLSNVRALMQQAKIVVVSADESPKHIVGALDAGAGGFIPKSSDPAVLVAALRLVLMGHIYLPPQVMAYAPKSESNAREAYANLSAGQKRVLDEVLAGKANKVIAIELDLAIGTVKSHLSVAYKALGVANRTEAVIALSKDG